MSRFVLTAQLQLQAPRNVGQVVSQIQRQLSGINVNVNVQGAAQAQSQVNNLSKSADRASTAADKMGRSFGNAIRRFSAMAIATRAVSLFTNTLADAVRESISFERQLIKISQVTGKTISQLGSLTRTISNLSTTLGTSSSSLLNVSRILSQAGLSARETQVALSTLARTDLAPTFDNITETAEGAVAIFNQFRQGAAALEAQLGSINAVAGQFAVEAGDLISVVRRTGGVFKAAGGELNELIALFTSVRSTTRESAESIATGLRTIFTRIQRPKTIEYLKKYGVELTDLEGKFVGPYEAVRRLSGALAGLEEGDITFVQIAEELGGFRQIGKVIPLLQQFSVAQQALNVAQEGSSSLAKDAATAQLSLAVRVTKVKEEFLELIRAVTATPTFQIMASSALTLASALIKVLDSLKSILPVITAIAAVKFVRGFSGFLGGVAGGLSGGRGFNTGGKVTAFARGGMVPGTGNRDTVPAMLTPGEFVIKKSSVAKLGSGNLEAMNKYAAGGMVTSGRHTYGPKSKPATKKLTQAEINKKAAETRARNEAARRQKGDEAVDPNDMLDNTGKPLPTFGLAALRGSSKTYPAQRLPQTGKRVKMQFGVLPEAKANKYESKMRDSVKKISGEMAKDFAGDIKDSPIDVNQLMDKAGFANAVGAFFETAIALTGSPYTVEKGAINESIDFAGGLGAAAKTFGLSGIASSPTDATRTAGADGKSASKFAGQVERYLLKTGKISLPASPVKKASGGSISGGVGTDTVPALLTPGEFVVNKQSAQKIGYGSLNRMNKVGKYAKGGTVQKFAGGGKAGSSGGAGGVLGLGGVTEGLFAVQMGLSMLTPTIDESSSAFEKISASVMTSFGSMIAILTMVQAALASFGMQLKAQDIGKFVSNIFKTGKGGLGDRLGGFQRQTRTGFGGKKATVTTRTKGESLREGFDLAQERKARAGQLREYRKNNPMVSNNGRTINFGRNDSARSQFGGKLSRGGNSLTSKLGKFFGQKAAGGGVGGRIAGAAARGLSGFGGATGALGGGAVGGIASSLTAVAGPLAAFAIGMKVVGSLVSGFRDLDARLQAAIKAQDTQKATSLAVSASVEKSWGGVIGGVAAMFDNFSASGSGVTDFLQGISAAMGGQSVAAIKSSVAAQIQSAKTAKSLSEAQKTASTAMEDLKNGTISAAAALAQVQAQTSEAKKNQDLAGEANLQNAAGKGGLTRDIFTLGGLLGETSTQRNNRIDQENEKRSQDAMKQRGEAFQMGSQLRSATARSIFAGGGSIQDAKKALGDESPESLRDEAIEKRKQAFAAAGRGDEGTAKIFEAEAKQLSDQANQVEKSLANLKKEVEKQQKYFAAMNLGLNSAVGAAGAFSDAMDNYTASQEAGNVSVMRNFATLEAGITSAAAGMGDGKFAKAAKEGAEVLRGFGADKEAQQFEDNLKMINQAQAGSEAGLKTFRQQLEKDATKGVNAMTGEEKFEGLFNTITDGSGMDENMKEKLKDMLGGMDIDYNKIAEGDFSQVQEVFQKLGAETLEQAKAIFEAEQKYQETIVQAAKNRAEAENNLTDAIRQQMDYEKESREIIASAGGPAFTPQQQREMAVDRYNAGVGQGQAALGGTSAADIRQQQKDLKRRQAEIGAIRTQAAGPDDDPLAIAQRKKLQGEGGVKLSNEEANLTKQNQELYNTTKTLIDIKKQEVNIIKEKNKLEKQGMESLLAGDIEGFFDAQTTQGAMGAIASGNTADFSADDLYKAYQEIKRQADAGVTEINGQQIQGSGGLLERAAAATAEARGLDPAQAAMVARGATGETPEEQSLNKEIQALAATIPAFGDMAISAAQQQIEAAVALKESAEALKISAVDAATKSRGGLIYASKGRLINFVPKGTDTVPAMLTPGEFVVNRAAVQRGNNLQLLKAMNQGARTAAAASPTGMSRGGVIYRSGGSDNPESSSGGGSLVGMDSGAMEKFANALNKFSDQIKETINTLQATKFQVQLDSTSLNINVSGSSFLENLSGAINDEVIDSITSELTKYRVGENGRLKKDASEVSGGGGW